MSSKKIFREAPLTEKEQEIGGFLVLEFALAPRADRQNPCKYCRQNIDYPENETFIAVITEKTENYMFHKTCYPLSTFDEDIYKNGDPECAECGHAYHRHYDLFEDDCPPVGCKYCDCMVWVPKDDWKYPNRNKQ